ncbi:MAG: site-2 protease family protein [Planctomycetes bacterium]|nr:site-2 protease family protein [Planctomycetota bacterium]
MDQPQPARPTAPRGRAGGIALGRIFGIEIRMHFSVLLIFGLVAFSLASYTFPGWHPDWSPALNWSLGLATALLFFISLLLHELAHSLVAKWKGIEIDRITLFLFGGVSELKSDPKTAGTEFLVAIAGPAMSVLIGVVSILLASLMVGPDFTRRVSEHPEATMKTLGALPTLLLWLGPINLVLAAFNMIPGFPLDGGRVLRSILWAITGDLRKATMWATTAGKVIAFGLMGLGGIEIFYGGFINGLWMLFIGWFLYSAARNSANQMQLRTSLQGHHLSELMDTGFAFAPADVDIDSFTRELVMHRSQSLWPVTQDGEVIGIVTLDDLAEVPPEARAHIKLGKIARPLDDVDFVSADLPGEEIMRKLAESDYGVMLVLEGGKVVGLIRQADIMRWMVMHPG